jgi:hypothetical protein
MRPESAPHARLRLLECLNVDNQLPKNHEGVLRVLDTIIRQWHIMFDKMRSNAGQGTVQL